MAALNAAGTRVELRGGAYRVRFDMNALIEVEDHYGDLDGAQLAMQLKPMRNARYMLWVAGKWEGEGAGPETEQELGALMDPVKVAEYSDAIGVALMESIGLTEEQIAEAVEAGKAVAARVNGATPSPS